MRKPVVLMCVLIVALIAAAAGCSDPSTEAGQDQISAEFDEVVLATNAFTHARMSHGVTSDRELFANAEAVAQLTAAAERFDRAAAKVLRHDLSIYHPDRRAQARKINAALRDYRSSLDAYMTAGAAADWAAVERHRVRTERAHAQLATALNAP